MRHVVLAFSIVTLFGFAPAAKAETFKRLTDQATFEATVVGKRLTSEDGRVTVKKNGTLTGRFDKQRLIGSWEWQKGLFCRTVQLGKNAPRGACQRVEVTSKQVRFTTTKGNRVTTYNF